MIPLKVTICVIIIILILLLLIRKSKGLQGSWDSRKDIQEYALIMGDSSLINEELSTVKTDKKIKVFREPALVNKTKTNESIGEKICRDHIEKRLSTPFPNERPDFLKNTVTNANLELDCFSNKLKLALEYNGKQHYEFIPKFHKTKNDFYNQKYRDIMKKRLCFENGIDLIEVPYTVKFGEIPFYIDSALEKLGYIKLV